MTGILNTKNIDALATLAEEATRATESGTRRFLEPGIGTLRRAKSNRHHIVFGRRGSGKTSLLRKAAVDLKGDKRAIAFVDVGPFTGHSYPDVLISILIETFKSFKVWIEESSSAKPAEKKAFRNLFGLLKTSKVKKNKKISRELTKALGEYIQELDELLHLADDSELHRTEKRETKESRTKKMSGGGNVRGAEGAASYSKADERNVGEDISEKYRRSKLDFLRQNILKYREIFRSLSEISGSSSFLFLDDLYYIHRDHQPHLLDYVHGIAKGNDLWLKIGTIRHRSRWYVQSELPVGLKLGDDADNIDLDLTLETYASAKKFLVAILAGLVEECEAPPTNQFLAEGAVDRLVLASGGVARDFLGLFWRSIEVAGERLNLDKKHYRGEKIGAEDVNIAAGKYGDLKMEEFKKDTLDDQERLEDAFKRVGNFCINTARANCFLLDQDSNGTENNLIQELVDLRLIHLVRSRVTVSSRPGKAYRAYMLDVSQYTGSRKRRDYEMLEFWRKGSREQLRRASLIYDPSSYEQLTS